MAAGIDPPSAAAISREYADQLPYASMAAWFDDAAKALLVLAEFGPNGTLVWQSAERQTIVTDGPFVVRSLGTELELRGASFAPPIGDVRRMIGQTATRTFDVLAEGERVGFAVRSTFAAADIEDVDIFGKPRRLRRIVESVRSDGKARYRNHYWIDEEDGFCWKSRQIVVPTLPHLNTEILKRPSR